MSSVFDKACSYAINSHKGQVRKDGSIYILHPFEVATIASTMTNDIEILSAAMLHDVIEDCNADIEELKSIFSERIVNFVMLETETKYNDLSKQESWKKRKMEALERLDFTDDIGYKILFLSDKLANIRSLYRDFNKNGISAFDKFNVKDINEQAWFYFEILDKTSELKEYDAYKEYEDKINIIFNNIRRKDDGKKGYTL